MSDIENLKALGYENIHGDYVIGLGEPIYTATIYGLSVTGCEDTLSFLSQALSQNREETNLWKGLVWKGVRN